MSNKDRSFHEAPEKAGGEGWLYSEQQQKLCHFKPDTATVHAQWVAIRTYSYVPPRPPEPMTRRRMLRHNAIEAWQTMQKTGWRRCPRLSDSYQLGMTRPQRIAVTAFLSALFVPSLFLLPVWCLKSEGMRSLLGDLSSSAPPLVTTVVAGAIPLIVFAVLCSVFAWVVARIWR